MMIAHYQWTRHQWVSQAETVKPNRKITQQSMKKNPFKFWFQKKKPLLNFTMYVVPQKRKRNSRIC